MDMAVTLNYLKLHIEAAEAAPATLLHRGCPPAPWEQPASPSSYYRCSPATQLLDKTFDLEPKTWGE